MNHLSPSTLGVYVRGAMYILIAMLGMIVSDPAFRAMLGDRTISILGVVLAGIVSARAFIDNSVAQNKQAEGSAAATVTALASVGAASIASGAADAAQDAVEARIQAMREEYEAKVAAELANLKAGKL